MSRYGLIKATLGPVLSLVCRPKMRGKEHIPPTGPVILAGNHVAFLDSLILQLVCQRRVIFIGKGEYMTGKGFKGKLQSWFFSSGGMIPVDRGHVGAASAALMTGCRLLNEGHAFGVFPEGTRSPDGRLYRGRTGIARLALMTGAPIVPFAVTGTEKVQPSGAGLPRPARVKVSFGAPLEFSRYDGLERDRYVLRAITDTVMNEVRQLSGQEYVDVYATKIKTSQAVRG
ncbi:lysophospholipid acyltransferase family protein [Streptomyces lavendofoliae]|uniref:lysophospholipid acyltransferase family protein n=1 Tax=Streptomyces lavendofoliae TaxID=67314 RepID=UPI0027E49374|nr:lysophospholipid acyltransferase family protein [Streptomyces lavendofoliae]